MVDNFYKKSEELRKDSNEQYKTEIKKITKQK